MTFVELLPVFMFVALALLLFTGFPVAFILGGVGLGFAFLAQELGAFNVARLVIIPNRIFGSTMENPVLVAIPMFIFMGTMLEKSGVAKDLLHCLQVLTRRVPGGLALSVTLMGTIMAATTGIIGASVVMITLLALPVMLERNYNIPLATGTIAASGTLGILIPPSIMLVIMSDLMSIPVGTVFVAAIVPGLLLSALYALYIIVLCRLKPQLAPPLPDDIGPQDSAEFWAMIFKSFVPPVFLIVIVLGSIFAGLATPTEAAGVGAAGATLLALLNRKLTFGVLQDVCHRSALTGAMLFGIFLGATCFSLVFRWLGGEALIDEFIAWAGVGP
jgi:tripartite ATP-independent transporter DctM subunit